ATKFVTPAKAGVYSPYLNIISEWIPAFAGVTHHLGNTMDIERYNVRESEARWQQRWEEARVFEVAHESPLPWRERVRERGQQPAPTYQTYLVEYAKELRSEQSDAEAKLWYFLRAH